MVGTVEGSVACMLATNSAATPVDGGPVARPGGPPRGTHHRAAPVVRQQRQVLCRGGPSLGTQRLALQHHACAKVKTRIVCECERSASGSRWDMSPV